MAKRVSTGVLAALMVTAAFVAMSATPGHADDPPLSECVWIWTEDVPDCL